MLRYEEQSKRAGTRVSADDGADRSDQFDVCAVLSLKNLLELERIVYAITVRDIRRVVCRVFDQLAVLLCQSDDSSASSACFSHADQMTFIVNMKHGLDAQQITDESNGRANTAAALEIDQIIHREPVAKTGN